MGCNAGVYQSRDGIMGFDWGKEMEEGVGRLVVYSRWDKGGEREGERILIVWWFMGGRGGRLSFLLFVARGL